MGSLDRVMPMNFDYVELSNDDAIATITINRPDVMNAISRKVYAELDEAFRIAEQDLELRGPWEVLGTRQTGMLQFRVADLARDQQLLKSIPAVADRLLTENPGRVDKLISRWIGDAARFAVV